LHLLPPLGEWYLRDAAVARGVYTDQVVYTVTGVKPSGGYLTHSYPLIFLFLFCLNVFCWLFLNSILYVYILKENRKELHHIDRGAKQYYDAAPVQPLTASAPNFVLKIY
jgi:hypothetical protein